MDYKKIIKDYVYSVANYVEVEYRTKGTRFFFDDIRSSRFNYVIMDKGIDRQIEKILKKRLGIDVLVAIEFLNNDKVYLDCELTIRLYPKEPYCILD